MKCVEATVGSSSCFSPSFEPLYIPSSLGVNTFIDGVYHRPRKKLILLLNETRPMSCCVFSIAYSMTARKVFRCFTALPDNKTTVVELHKSSICKRQYHISLFWSTNRPNTKLFRRSCMYTSKARPMQPILLRYNQRKLLVHQVINFRNFMVIMSLII
jgi:hypothetical protein